MPLELGPEGCDETTGEWVERKAFQGEGAVCAKVRNHQDLMCLWERRFMLLVQRRGRGKTRAGFGLDIHNGEQGTASREASDMPKCVLGGALWFNSTKGLEEARMVLALPTCTVAIFITYSHPLILLTSVSWSFWGVGYGCPLRCPELAGQWAYRWR